MRERDITYNSDCVLCPPGLFWAEFLELGRFWSWLKAQPAFSYRQWPYIITFRHCVSLFSERIDYKSVIQDWTGRASCKLSRGCLLASGFGLW